MRPAPVPRNEPQRLEILHSLNILDTITESIPDAIAAAAAGIANVPISAISLVDADRQWFKASCGLDASQTGRDISFCAHAILSADPLIVHDAQADERFSDNPLVTGPPYIRFYAGFPLIVNGASLGALCLIDDLPRSLTASQISRLKDLAAMTSDWISNPAKRAPK